jgi:hypothetical protein
MVTQLYLLSGGIFLIMVARYLPKRQISRCYRPDNLPGIKIILPVKPDGAVIEPILKNNGTVVEVPSPVKGRMPFYFIGGCSFQRYPVPRYV